MEEEQAFILWAIKDGEVDLLPSYFPVGEMAMFWAEIFQALTGAPIVVDVAPADELFQHILRCRWAADISEEAFVNAYRNMEEFCKRHGGIAGRDSRVGRRDPVGVELEKEEWRLLFSLFGR